MSETADRPSAPAEAPLDLSEVETSYANWYRITGTGEELLMEFALTPHLGIVTDDPIRVKQRLVLSFYTAKRLLAHLHYALKRHESFFGPLEMDLHKRIKGQPGDGQ